MERHASRTRTRSESAHELRICWASTDDALGSASALAANAKQKRKRQPEDRDAMANAALKTVSQEGPDAQVTNRKTNDFQGPMQAESRRNALHQANGRRSTGMQGGRCQNKRQDNLGQSRRCQTSQHPIKPLGLQRNAHNRATAHAQGHATMQALAQTSFCLGEKRLKSTCTPPSDTGQH